MLGGSTAILIAAELSTVRLSGLLLAIGANRELAARCREYTPEPSDKDRQPKDAHVDERQQRAAHLGGLPVDECERRSGEDIGDTVPVEPPSCPEVGQPTHGFLGADVGGGRPQVDSQLAALRGLGTPGQSPQVAVESPHSPLDTEPVCPDQGSTHFTLPL